MLSDDLLASCSWDTIVRIWNLTTFSLKYTLNGHNSDVYGLTLLGLEVIASGPSDNTINLWNITNGTLIRTLTAHTNWIYYGLDLLGSDTLISGSLDSTIKLWQISKGGTLSNSINVSSIMQYIYTHWRSLIAIKK